jgi:hypothetical protein
MNDDARNHEREDQPKPRLGLTSTSKSSIGIRAKNGLEIVDIMDIL